jgi:hypothetical protein
MTDEAQRIIKTIKQMDASLDDVKTANYEHGDEELRVSFPLVKCLQSLKGKLAVISKIHKERFEQVKSTYRTVERVICIPNPHGTNKRQSSYKPSIHTRRISSQHSSRSLSHPHHQMHPFRQRLTCRHLTLRRLTRNFPVYMKSIPVESPPFKQYPKTS